MSELGQVLDAFYRATCCTAAVWMEQAAGAPVVEAATPLAPTPDRFPAAREGEQRLASPKGALLVAAIPGPRRAWLSLGPCETGDDDLGKHMNLMLPVVSQYLQSALEVEHAANELAER